MVPVPDPYEALGLSHNATTAQIKVAYRRLALQYHPDRLTRQNASEEQKEVATKKFAQVASAYQLLSDQRQKREYDHIYKYGGYDDDPARSSTRTCSQRNSAPRTVDPFSSHVRNPQNAKSSRKGIGYTFFDPVQFLCSNGQTQSAAIAGIQIPSRVHLSRPPPGGGVRVAFSAGQVTTSASGAKKYVSKTTQFVEGKKYSRVETTTVHPDGRKEVIIEGNDYVERRYSRAPPKKKTSSPSLRRSSTGEDVAQAEESNLPWYMEAWHGIREKMTMCHNPCGMTLAH